MLIYLISGLVVASEVALSGVAEPTYTSAQPDVRIKRASLPATLDQAIVLGPNWMIAKDDFLLRVPGVARMRVRCGREIEVEIDGTEADVSPFLLGTCFGVLMHQRGELVLHASAVSYNGKAIAICGPSGMGKSTLSAALCQTGCSFISDDVSTIRFRADGRSEVLPDSRSHRLWADVIEPLALSDRRGEAVRETMQKYHVEPTSSISAIPLAMILVLRQADIHDHPPVIEPLALSDAAAYLRSDVFRSRLASHMGLDKALFAQIARLLPHVKVHRLTRPEGIDRLEDTVNRVKEHIFEKLA